jgi:hypothetical protein
MCYDPEVLAMLSFLENDINDNLERLQPMSADLCSKIASFTKGIVFDPDEPIEGYVSL